MGTGSGIYLFVVVVGHGWPWRWRVRGDRGRRAPHVERLGYRPPVPHRGNQCKAGQARRAPGLSHPNSGYNENPAVKSQLSKTRGFPPAPPQHHITHGRKKPLPPLRPKKKCFSSEGSAGLGDVALSLYHIYLAVKLLSARH